MTCVGTRPDWVPSESILQLGGGNTGEEIEELQRAARQHGWKRIGLVTSSWHMRRAMSYAEGRELKLVPLPAGVSGTRRAWSFGEHVVPRAKGFLANEFAVKEMLGSILP